MKYFENRFIYKLESSNYLAMCEPNYRRNECYIYVPNEDKNNYYIILRDLYKHPLDEKRIMSLTEVLNEYSFYENDFLNPITRTKKVVQTLDVINEFEKKKKVYTKKI